MKRTVYGVGFLDGLEPHLDKGLYEVYTIWKNMLKRCYSEVHLTLFPSYRGCYVAEEWHSLKTFKDWVESQPRKSGWHLDKDLMVAGNKEYGPEVCSFVPHQINSLLINSVPKNRLPVGVTVDKKKFAANVSYSGKKKFLGNYSTPEKAFNRYKRYKEQLVKLVAEKYKKDLNTSVYEYLMSYEVVQ